MSASYAAHNGAMPCADPRHMLARAPMRWQQIMAIGFCALLNALDGYDVLSISFASPGIAAQWHVARAALGIVLSMEIIGMGVGSVLLGRLADRIGRVPVVIGCLAVMALGMLATTQAPSIAVLAATRLLTGLGIGGMLATTNALAAEYANDRRRPTAVALMAAGYPVGAIIGGAAASALLVHGDWRQVFFLGAGAALVLLPLVVLVLPEPVGALMQRGQDDALSRVNRSLRSLGHAPVASLPTPTPRAPKSAPRAPESAPTPGLLSAQMRALTLMLTLAYFLHVLSFYFVIKWVPKIVVDMGFAPSAAGGVLVWANVGGLAGALAFSFAVTRVALRPLLIATMCASAVLVALFGHAPADLHLLALAAGAAAFFTNGGIVGLYALIAGSFPASLRAGGSGLVIGIGRSGAAVGPIVAGFLFQAGFGLGLVAALMALGSGLSAVILALMPKRPPHQTD